MSVTRPEIVRRTLTMLRAITKIPAQYRRNSRFEVRFEGRSFAAKPDPQSYGVGCSKSYRIEQQCPYAHTAYLVRVDEDADLSHLQALARRVLTIFPFHPRSDTKFVLLSSPHLA